MESPITMVVYVLGERNLFQNEANDRFAHLLYEPCGNTCVGSNKHKAKLSDTFLLGPVTRTGSWTGYSVFYVFDLICIFRGHNAAFKPHRDTQRRLIGA